MHVVVVVSPPRLEPRRKERRVISCSSSRRLDRTSRDTLSRCGSRCRRRQVEFARVFDDLRHPLLYHSIAHDRPPFPLVDRYCRPSWCTSSVIREVVKGIGSFLKLTLLLHDCSCSFPRGLFLRQSVRLFLFLRQLLCFLLGLLRIERDLRSLRSRSGSDRVV